MRHSGIYRRIRQGRAAAADGRLDAAAFHRNHAAIAPVLASSCASAPATCWRSAAAPASTRWRSPSGCLDHLVADRSQRQPPAQHRRLARHMRSSANVKRAGAARRQRGRLAARRARPAVGSSSRCSAPMSSTSRRGRWRRACSPPPAGISSPAAGCSSTARSAATAFTMRRATPEFDESLRNRNPEWGVRDTADLRKLADANGLAPRRSWSRCRRTTPCWCSSEP